MQMERFFDELVPRLETAKVLDRELDRNLARRFNVLDYLRTDELGLSRIIADLLNPCKTHGQGVLFLGAFLERLKSSGKGPDWPDLERSEVSVVREWPTKEGRIDVVVTIKGPVGKTHCLAFENKPYETKRENPVWDYLGSLKGKSGEDFLLIYLTPRGEGPSESSISQDELAKWKNHFAIMPYVDRQEEWEDGFDEYRLKGHALADWLGECRKNCEVDRLRWFLGDMETFCQRKFGDKAMSGDCETKAVKEFVGEDPDKLRTAEAVYKAWPDIKKEACSRFLQRLKEEIEKEAIGRIVGDMQVEWEYAGEAKYTNHVWLYRESWADYQGEGCSSICLQNQEVGPNGWCIGVSSPVSREKMTKENRERRGRLENELLAYLGPGKGDQEWWAWWSWDWVEEEKKSWDSLVLEPHKENQDITKYLARRFIDIAERAVPIIDQIEGDTTA